MVLETINVYFILIRIRIMQLYFQYRVKRIYTSTEDFLVVTSRKNISLQAH